jgi:hypothetical protein
MHLGIWGIGSAACQYALGGRRCAGLGFSSFMVWRWRAFPSFFTFVGSFVLPLRPESCVTNLCISFLKSVNDDISLIRNMKSLLESSMSSLA